MKILLVHNNYGKYSGEEAVVDRMLSMYCRLGYDVAQLRMTTEGIRDSFAGKVRGFVAGVYSPVGVRAMRDMIEREHPDVVNVHNLYPFISPAALRECKRLGVPVVMTVHNFRLICPTGLFMRDGRPCETCLVRGDEWGCIKYNCEHSVMKSLGYAARNYVARMRRYYFECVDRFVCITHFQKQKLTTAGFDAKRIVVIPNGIDVVENVDAAPIGEYIGYLGRLSFEKGYDLLLEVARRHPEMQFRFAGAQRFSGDIKIPHNVRLLGYVKGRELTNFIRNCRFIVMPSRCYEGFPMTILEVAQYNKPVIGPRHGGFVEIIGTDSDAIGRLFEPGSVADLERQIVALWNDRRAISDLGVLANTKLKKCYSYEIISKSWQSLLCSVINKK